jgi:hypothetical protein
MHNHTQATHAANAADMQHQSLTPPSAASHSSLAHQQFFQHEAVQQRLAAACKEFSDCSTALKSARAGRERFVLACNKNGAMKRLPAKLQWGLSKAVALSRDGVQDDFYSDERKQLAAIERDASDKAYDILLAAKDKHIAHLATCSNTRSFVEATEQAFAAELGRIADKFDQQSQADSSALSQTAYSFPRAAVAQYFSEELLRRLQAMQLAAVTADSAEERRLAANLTAEHQAKETVLAGAHTGETLSRLAEQAARKTMAPLELKLDKMLQQLQQHMPQPPAPFKPHGHQPSNRRPFHADASSSSHARTPQAPAAHRGSARRIDVGAAGQKRQRRDEQEEEEVIAPSSFTVSIPDNPPHAAKRPKVVTFPRRAKNGAGGDRSPRQDSPQQQPANAPRHQHARHHGRGPRSDERQP